MKTLNSLGLLLLIVSVSYTANAQIQMMNEMSITPPSYKTAAYENLHDFLKASVEYPSRSVKAGLQGTEVIRFSVTPCGNIEDISVINSVSDEIDMEVIRALRKTNGKWEPGTIDGEASKLTGEVSLIFALNSYEDILQDARYYLQTGNSLMFKKNKPEKALYYFGKAYELFPNEESVLLSLGTCLNKLGQTSKAGALIERFHYLSDLYYPAGRPEGYKTIPHFIYTADLIVEAGY